MMSKGDNFGQLVGSVVMIKEARDEAVTVIKSRTRFDPEYEKEGPDFSNVEKERDKT